MASPGTGVQHLLNLTDRPSTPSTITPPLDFFLRVTIPFAFELEVEEGVPQGVPQSVPQGFSEMQKKIFQCIKENPKVSRQKIAEKLGVSMKTIARNLLQMKNCVQFVGRGYSGHWEIVV